MQTFALLIQQQYPPYILLLQVMLDANRVPRYSQCKWVMAFRDVCSSRNIMSGDNRNLDLTELLTIFAEV